VRGLVDLVLAAVDDVVERAPTVGHAARRTDVHADLEQALVHAGERVH